MSEDVGTASDRQVARLSCEDTDCCRFLKSTKARPHEDHTCFLSRRNIITIRSVLGGTLFLLFIECWVPTSQGMAKRCMNAPFVNPPHSSQSECLSLERIPALLMMHS